MIRPRALPFLVLIFCVGFVGRLAAADPRPSLVFILADDLGLADLGSQAGRIIDLPPTCPDVARIVYPETDAGHDTTPVDLDIGLDIDLDHDPARLIA